MRLRGLRLRGLRGLRFPSSHLRLGNHPDNRIPAFIAYPMVCRLLPHRNMNLKKRIERLYGHKQLLLLVVLLWISKRELKVYSTTINQYHALGARISKRELKVVERPLDAHVDRVNPQLQNLKKRIECCWAPAWCSRASEPESQKENWKMNDSAFLKISRSSLWISKRELKGIMLKSRAVGGSFLMNLKKRIERNLIHLFYNQLSYVRISKRELKAIRGRTIRVDGDELGISKRELKACELISLPIAYATWESQKENWKERQ